MMKKDLQEACGLPITFDPDTLELILSDGLNHPSYCTRKLHDLDSVWAHPVTENDRVIYRYTGGLYLPGDGAAWSRAKVIYGIVLFTPGVFGGEYVKSSGQYHPPISPSNRATPEIYTVLSGTGHFLLQKASQPYDTVEDVVLVEVEAGESFVVPPDYGHLQINPSSEPLVFSYAVMDGMKGQYDAYKVKGGAAYYVMADREQRFIFNHRYGDPMPLRIVRASDICQLPWLKRPVTYQVLRDHLPEMKFLTDPTMFPESAYLYAAENPVRKSKCQSFTQAV